MLAARKHDSPPPVPHGTRHVLCVMTGWAVALSSAACERSTLTDGLPETTDCATCHGSPGDPAPPSAVDGSSSTSHVGVGAHQSHLKSTIARPVACTECHVIPTSLLSHPDPKGGPAPVVFGPLSAALGALPEWDRASTTCADTYCHGATLPEAETRAPPRWTVVDGSQKACTSCHGNPPGGVHPASATCQDCHSAVVGPDGSITNPALHVNGMVELGPGDVAHPPGYADPILHGPDTYRGASDCRLCHGALLEGAGTVVGCDDCHQPGWRTNCVYCHGGVLEASGAPPDDLLGGTATTSLGVGSHTEHVTRTTHPPYACTECHIPITDVMTPGHLFDSTAGRSEVVFNYGISPQGQYSPPGCSALYCHGTGLVDGSAATFIPPGGLTCESCHPAATQSVSHVLHTFAPCSTCHLDVVDDGGAVTNPDLHVNGAVEVTMSPGTWIAETNTCSDCGCHLEDIVW